MTALAEPLPTGRTALLVGATGLVGTHCLELLLGDPRYARVRVLARHRPDRRHPRLEVHLVDFDNLDASSDLFAVDDVFCCLGTTMARAGSERAFRVVDHDYPMRIAELASGHRADQFLLVSALGADQQSRLFYNRVKGEAEVAVKRLPFRAVWIFRPSLLLGERKETRLGERLASAVTVPFTPLMLGPLRRYRPIAARDVAAAMVTLATSQGTGAIVESEEIAAIARSLP